MSSVRVKNTATRQRYEQNSGEVQGGLPIEKDTISGASLGEPRAKAEQKNTGLRLRQPEIGLSADTIL